jgi:ribosomal protein L37AE/L43A
MENPFTPDSIRYEVFEILKDGKWHCTKCELPAAQAATFRDMKKKGIVFDTDEEGHEYKKKYCPKCRTERIFRKMKI